MPLAYELFSTCSKNCSTINQITPQPMCVEQQEVGFVTNSLCCSYSIEVLCTTMKRIKVKQTEMKTFVKVWGVFSFSFSEKKKINKLVICPSLFHCTTQSTALFLCETKNHNTHQASNK